MMIMGAFLAYLLIRLSGADREVMEKWLYVIVGLVFIAGIIGTAHHYYWVGVPTYWLPIGGFFSALEPLALVGMAAYAYGAMRRSGLAHPNTLALHWTIGSAVFALFGAGLLGLAHTWPSVNKWTHGTQTVAIPAPPKPSPRPITRGRPRTWKATSASRLPSPAPIWCRGTCTRPVAFPSCRPGMATV